MTRAAKTLLVDDSAFVLDMMENTLGEYGVLDITKAENGQQGLELFASAQASGAPFSLVFLDIEMPVMDGQEALKRMRAVEREAGVRDDDRAIIIMATALHSPADMMNAIIDGDCSDYFVKTFEIEEIGGLLAKYGFIGSAV
jgi:two-component system, chemotaxis family, chemotaxis protein CheY